MSLTRYHAKRHFGRTAEPRGRVAKKNAAKLSFVVQKHAASHLHYDFRLELDGVLLSWAVPKGPSLDPSEKRLAVHVEDHPLDYAEFEGTIPAGEYGGGTVMVWDRGTWTPHDDDPRAAYRRGKLTFDLQGKKLRGAWTLVRMHGRPSSSGENKNWLLLKADDDEARPLAEGDVLEEHPYSAKMFRDLEGIASGAKPRRRAPTAAAKKPAAKKTAKAKSTRARKSASAKSARPRASAKKSTGGRRKRSDDDGPRGTDPLPRHPEVQLATLVTAAPEGDAWLHEVKFDGYRMTAILDEGRVTMRSRNDGDWTAKLPSLVAPLAALPVDQAVLDGEVVVLDDDGVSRFQLLQNALGATPGARPPMYFVFDLLHLNGTNTAQLPLDDRKALLKKLLSGQPKSSPVRYSDHTIGDGPRQHKAACRAGLEGIISKRRAAPYLAGRTGEWLKSKCRLEQEFVIAGYTEPEGSRVGFGALLLGYFDRRHGLTYAGRVGSGFNEQLLRSLAPELKKLERRDSPYERGTEAARGRGVHWVRPTKVAQVEFADWTHDGLLRQATFRGLRLDKPAKQVVRERPKVRSGK